VRALAASAALLLAGCVPQDPPEIDTSLLVVTFNTGTTDGLAHDAGPDDGYTSAHAETSDLYYGNGLAWLPAVDAAAAFFDELQPHLIAFQETFWTGECSDIPEDAWPDFICSQSPSDVEGGAPSVANSILGNDYQVACHPGKPDKCLAVRRDWGSIRDCSDDLCLDGLTGTTVDGCGSGARIARAVIDLPAGAEMSVVNVHGSSGLSEEDADCRTAQFEQVFEDLGDDAPGANGARNLILGDLNTDPGRYGSIDASAARWNQGIADGGFVVHTEVGIDATPTYGGLTNIDHVASDSFVGDCVHPGLGTSAPVTDAVYFDHLPAVCRLRLP
jgi:hypothetical protein